MEEGRGGVPWRCWRELFVQSGDGMRLWQEGGEDVWVVLSGRLAPWDGGLCSGSLDTEGGVRMIPMKFDHRILEPMVRVLPFRIKMQVKCCTGIEASALRSTLATRSLPFVLLPSVKRLEASRSDA